MSLFHCAIPARKSATRYLRGGNISCRMYRNGHTFGVFDLWSVLISHGVGMRPRVFHTRCRFLEESGSPACGSSRKVDIYSGCCLFTTCGSSKLGPPVLQVRTRTTLFYSRCYNCYRSMIVLSEAQTRNRCFSVLRFADSTVNCGSKDYGGRCRGDWIIRLSACKYPLEHEFLLSVRVRRSGLQMHLFWV